MSNLEVTAKYYKDYCYTCLERPLGLQEVKAPMNSGQWAYVGGKVVSLTHQPPLPPEDILDTGWAVLDRIPVEARTSTTVQAGPEAHPISRITGIGYLSRGKAAGAWS